MISQRERLATLLADAQLDVTIPLSPQFEQQLADALIARGVRAIDRRLLEEVTINRCADPYGADCESCKRGAKELVDFLNDQEDDR